MAITRTGFDANRVIRTPGQQKLAITVLAGGPSGEREVSLESGKCVAEALESLGHNVHLEDVSPDNLAALARAVDCVFVALHGRFGEDGQIQEILERRGLAYCGSGPQSCALAMDKVSAKARFESLGIPTPRYTVVDPSNLSNGIPGWEGPLVVKPVKEGSSLHCRIIRDNATLRSTVEEVVTLYGNALIEDYIPGMEITVPILGERALPPIEIRTSRDFYDYTAKYADDTTQYLFDIDLPPALIDQICRMSLEAHRGLGCRDFSRLDWRVDDKRGKAYLLELNVIPGLTSHSLLPKSAARAGYSFPQVCQMIVDFGIRRKFSK